MSDDLPDDDDFEAFDRRWPIGEIEKLLAMPDDIQAEHDYLLAKFNAKMGPPPPRLPPDLEKLEGEIAQIENLRAVDVELPPYRFDRFEAISTLKGGMGLVIKAHDPRLDRLVAIKLWVQPGREAQENLIAEAKTLARLRHPNVVTVYEPGIWNERVYFVMEWIEGVDGQAWMQDPRTWREVREVYAAAGRGLAAAHEAGIHHRDFKPSNVLIGNDGAVVVADFGVAASLHSPERDESGNRGGTLCYMAPERLGGKRGDERSDQFSFCAAMWRALFGQRPFAGETSEEMVAAVERGEIEEKPGVDVPAWLVAVVRKGLAFDPGERHPDMRTLLAALVDEPAGEAEVDDGVGGEEVAEVDGRVLHKRWPYVAIGLLSVSVMGLTLLVMGLVWERPPAPELPVAETVQVEPYELILEQIAADDFADVERLWWKHKSELTEVQKYQIANRCFTRAKELASADRTMAALAALTAQKLAAAMEKSGSPEARKAGGQLAADASGWIDEHGDHPPRSAD